MATVLHICADEQLLAVRGLFLRSLGFNVIGESDTVRAISLIAVNKRVDFVVLCHTLSVQEKFSLESALRAAGRTNVSLVELYNVDEPVTSGIKKEAGSEFLSFATSLAAFESMGEARTLPAAESIPVSASAHDAFRAIH